MNKICKHCNQNLSFDKFYKQKKSKDGYQHKCKKYSNLHRSILVSDLINAKIQREKEKKWSADKKVRNPEKFKENNTKSLIKIKYELSLELYKKMSDDQNNVCGICKKECSTYTRLSVDHYYVTGHIRGLLCNNCNRVIGLLKDNPNIICKAAIYLEKDNQNG